MTNYVQRGDTLPLVMSAVVASGQLVNVGKFTGVAATAGAVGASIEISLVGVYSLPKVSADVYTQGQQLKMDPATGLVNAAGAIVFGVAAEAAAAGSTSVLARLTPSAA
jgi:predicted RecA/RadA family phage recombinase